MNKLLTHEETLSLIAAAKQGDEKAREELVVKNIALVKSIVRGYLNRGIEFDDLLQIGSIGLLKAIDRYDEAFQVRFSTYAVPMIAGEIKRFLRDDGMIKVSRSLKENAIKIYRAGDQLKKKLGRDATLEELSKETGIPKEEIVHAVDSVKDPVSLYDPVFDNNDKSMLIDTLVVDNGLEEIDKLHLKELIGNLEEREKKIIMLRFYLDKTQSEIAEILGVSQVQVSRLLTKTLQKMKEASER